MPNPEKPIGDIPCGISGEMDTAVRGKRVWGQSPRNMGYSHSTGLSQTLETHLGTEVN